MSMYIGNFKGGRNENFMYGVEKETIWYDYDLISAYTTVMAMLGDPDYGKLKMLTESDLKTMGKSEILYSYTIIDCEFKFPDGVKYPSIACFAGKTSTVYPLSGKSLITGSEYLVALSQGCEFKIFEIVHIPFNSNNVKPFYSSIKEIQKLRSLHAKGGILNALYKELGNSQYGLTARGISSKKRFDVKVGKPLKVDVNEFANPLICTWITAIIRSIMGELLHYISLRKGKVVSVTTDGFITDLAGLENDLKGLEGLDRSEYLFLYTQYCSIRKDLSNKYEGLELKKSGRGIIA